MEWVRYNMPAVGQERRDGYFASVSGAVANGKSFSASQVYKSLQKDEGVLFSRQNWQRTHELPAVVLPALQI